jgi:hypothetical protein
MVMTFTPYNPALAFPAVGFIPGVGVVTREDLTTRISLLESDSLAVWSVGSILWTRGVDALDPDDTFTIPIIELVGERERYISSTHAHKVRVRLQIVVEQARM